MNFQQKKKKLNTGWFFPFVLIKGKRNAFKIIYVSVKCKRLIINVLLYNNMSGGGGGGGLSTAEMQQRQILIDFRFSGDGLNMPSITKAVNEKNF